MISKDLMDEVSHLNERLKNRKNISKLSREYIRNLITNEIGNFKVYDRFDVNKLKEIKESGSICVVDGSVNRIGANYPNYVEFFQSMALLSSDQEPWLRRIFCVHWWMNFRNVINSKSQKKIVCYRTCCSD